MKTATEVLKKVFDKHKMGDGTYWMKELPAHIHGMCIDAMEEYANQAFEAAREKLPHPDYDHIYDDFEDYKKAFSR